MAGTRLIHCVCCGLQQPAPHSAVVQAPAEAPRCVRCRAHRGETLAEVAQRDADHAQLYRRALTDAQDDILLANSERDWCREEMQGAYENRAVLIRALSAIEQEHHFRGSRCACGRRNCRAARALSEAKVHRLLRTFDEEQHTLQELRNANPELWPGSGDALWDFVDVTLVYPKRERRAVGRHRAG